MRAAIVCAIAFLWPSVAWSDYFPFGAGRSGTTVARAATYWTETNEIELIAWIHEFAGPPPLHISLDPNRFTFTLWNTRPAFSRVPDWDDLNLPSYPWWNARMDFGGEVSPSAINLTTTKEAVEWIGGTGEFEAVYVSRETNTVFPEYTLAQGVPPRYELTSRQNSILDRYGLTPTAVWAARFSYDDLGFLDHNAVFTGMLLGDHGDWTGNMQTDRFRALAIPEPSSVALAGVGVMMLLAHLARRPSFRERLRRFCQAQECLSYGLPSRRFFRRRN